MGLTCHVYNPWALRLIKLQCYLLHGSSTSWVLAPGVCVRPWVLTVNVLIEFVCCTSDCDQVQFSRYPSASHINKINFNARQIERELQGETVRALCGQSTYGQVGMRANARANAGQAGRWRAGRQMSGRAGWRAAELAAGGRTGQRMDGQTDAWMDAPSSHRHRICDRKISNVRTSSR